MIFHNHVGFQLLMPLLIGLLLQSQVCAQCRRSLTDVLCALEFGRRAPIHDPVRFKTCEDWDRGLWDCEYSSCYVGSSQAPQPLQTRLIFHHCGLVDWKRPWALYYKRPTVSAIHGESFIVNVTTGGVRAKGHSVHGQFHPGDSLRHYECHWNPSTGQNSVRLQCRRCCKRTL